MKICTLYNPKGGVAKTTTIFNLGYALAEKGKRVLFVDADPQCNLTELFLHSQTVESVYKSGQLPGTSVWEALAPRINAKRTNIDVDSIELINSPHSDDIFLFKGDVNLYSAEGELLQAFTQSFINNIHYKLTYVSFYDMLKRLGTRMNADYILIDLSPSAGALTRTSFLASDCFFIPIKPDIFSLQTLKVLASIFDGWILDHRKFYNDFYSLGLPIADGRPFFLGTIVQTFDNKERRNSQYINLSNEIIDNLKTNLVPVLEKYSTNERDLLAVCKKYGNYAAAYIPDFGSLRSVMLEKSKPIFNITQPDTEILLDDGVGFRGIVWENTKSIISSTKGIFYDLAERLMSMEEMLGEEK
ncbi:ParA family protein [Cohnella zeiphila]|uniref:AAA family ATPase n=1 Tax=Cohnella zeiphila TaxID=2761120 RepID=A0A7X0SQ33_9BACL|nr:AAA family ATPase [Cohnella zeiphila]MBB6732810.1 AAA family ATPase [Cohnella zeiphila]